jgi:hypothetical protein
MFTRATAGVLYFGFEHDRDATVIDGRAASWRRGRTENQRRIRIAAPASRSSRTRQVEPRIAARGLRRQDAVVHAAHVGAVTLPCRASLQTNLSEGVELGGELRIDPEFMCLPRVIDRPCRRR